MTPKQEKGILAALERARKKLPRSPRVVRLKHEFRLDSTGDEAIWIWIVYEDEDFDAGDPSMRRSEELLFRALLAAAEKQGFPRGTFIPHILVRTRSEQDEVDRFEVC